MLELSGHTFLREALVGETQTHTGTPVVDWRRCHALCFTRKAVRAQLRNRHLDLCFVLKSRSCVARQEQFEGGGQLDVHLANLLPVVDKWGDPSHLSSREFRRTYEMDI